MEQTKKTKAINKLNNVKKTKIVQNYQIAFGNISNLCRLADISRTTFYTWLESDPEFAADIQEQEMELNDDLKEVLIKKAGEGSTAELIFYLKSRHPEFKPQPVQINTQVNNYTQVTDDQKDKYGI